MQEKQYAIDILSAMAERTIKKLWVLIIILVLLLFGTNAAWIYYENQFVDETTVQEVWQDADNGTNSFIGGDYIGNAASQDDQNNANP